MNDVSTVDDSEAAAEGPVGRRRSAEATRAAILEAARAAFGRAGYDQVGLREIASAAGVDAALLVRYFGSKEGLFAAALADPAPPPFVFPEDRSAFGPWLAARLVDSVMHKDPGRMMLMHHAVAHPGAAEVLRRMLTERFIGPVGSYLGEPDGELRASLMFAHVSGFNMMRSIVKLEALTQADRDALVARLGKALQTYVEA